MTSYQIRYQINQSFKRVSIVHRQISQSMVCKYYHSGARVVKLEGKSWESTFIMKNSTLQDKIVRQFIENMYMTLNLGEQ